MTDEHNVEQEEIVEEPEPLDELAAARKERDEYLDALQRLKAEFDNYRKRVARDQQELAARAELMRAAQRNIVHKNHASRKVSRLSHQIAKLAK